MTRLTREGIYTIKIKNHPHTIMSPKSEIMRRGGYKCRTKEMHFQLRKQRLETILCIYTPTSKLQGKKTLQGKCKTKMYNRYRHK